MRSAYGWSEDEDSIFVAIADIFMSRESMSFMLSALISSIFFSVVVSSSNFSYSCLTPTLFLALIFSNPFFTGCGSCRNMLLVFNEF